MLVGQTDEGILMKLHAWIPRSNHRNLQYVRKNWQKIIF